MSSGAMLSTTTRLRLCVTVIVPLWVPPTLPAEATEDKPSGAASSNGSSCEAPSGSEAGANSITSSAPCAWASATIRSMASCVRLCTGTLRLSSTSSRSTVAPLSRYIRASLSSAEMTRKPSFWRIRTCGTYSLASLAHFSWLGAIGLAIVVGERLLADRAQCCVLVAGCGFLFLAQQRDQVFVGERHQTLLRPCGTTEGKPSAARGLSCEALAKQDIRRPSA